VSFAVRDLNNAAWAHAWRLSASTGTAARVKALMGSELTPSQLASLTDELMRHPPAGGPPTARVAEFARLSPEQQEAELQGELRKIMRRMRALDGSDDDDDCEGPDCEDWLGAQSDDGTG